MLGDIEIDVETAARWWPDGQAVELWLVEQNMNRTRIGVTRIRDERVGGRARFEIESCRDGVGGRCSLCVTPDLRHKGKIEAQDKLERKGGRRMDWKASMDGEWMD